MTFVVGATVLGGPKNEVIEASALGFLASIGESVVAFRFKDMISVRWRV